MVAGLWWKRPCAREFWRGIAARAKDAEVMAHIQPRRRGGLIPKGSNHSARGYEGRATLVWRRVLVEILDVSVWIYMLSLFAGLQIVDKTAPRLMDGIVPYLVPVPLVAVFVGWVLRRQKTVER